MFRNHTGFTIVPVLWSVLAPLVACTTTLNAGDNDATSVSIAIGGMGGMGGKPLMTADGGSGGTGSVVGGSSSSGIGGHGGSPVISSVCPEPVQPGSPWPMQGACSSRLGRTDRAGPTNPKIVWRFDAEAFIQTPPVVASDGTSYVVTASGRLVAVTAQGKFKWEYQFADATTSRSTPAIGEDGTVYVGTENNIVALSPLGAEIWKSNAWTGEKSAIAIGNDREIYAASKDGQLCAYASTGNLLWCRSTGAIWAYAITGFYPSIAIGANRVIASNSWDEKVIAWNEHGTPAWTFDEPCQVNSLSVALGHFVALTRCSEARVIDHLGEEVANANTGSDTSTAGIAEDGSFSILRNGYFVRYQTPDYKQTLSKQVPSDARSFALDSTGTAFVPITPVWDSTESILASVSSSGGGWTFTDDVQHAFPYADQTSPGSAVGDIGIYLAIGNEILLIGEK